MIGFKILQQFLVPSTLLLLAGVVGLFLVVTRKRGGILFVSLSLGGFYAFSITPVADIILSGLESPYEYLSEDEMMQSDTVVLLLGGGEHDVLRSSEVLRIVHSRNNSTRIIISGTNALNPENGEALNVQRFFVARGVPAENIIVEDKSMTTRENAQNTFDIISDYPFFLVTSAYHMQRSMEEFEDLGMRPIPAPTDFKSTGAYGLFDYVPNPQNLRNIDLAAHEYAGLLFYRLTR